MRQKTKTRTIIEEIDATDYERKPIDISNYGSVLTTRALIMGRYGMLNCGANFAKGYGGKCCNNCGTLDDESHRINDCIIYRGTNLYDSGEKLDFGHIYSNNMQQIMKVVEMILKMWDLGCGKNVMRK